MARRRRVALLIETSSAYARGLLDGVISYLRQRANWSVYLPEQQRGGAPPTWLANRKGDGIPWVETDDSRIAELAVMHFVDRGFLGFGSPSDGHVAEVVVQTGRHHGLL